VPAGAAVAADLNLLARTSAPLVPDTTSVVSLVMKSLLVPPSAVSVTIAVIASVSAGAPVSMVMAWLVVVPILPACQQSAPCR